MSKKLTRKLRLKDRDISAKKAKEIKGGGSQFGGGVQVALADGSVRNVSALNKKGITDGTSN